MSPAAARVLGLIGRLGESVELNGVEHRAVVQLMPKGQARNYFSDAEATVLPSLVWAALMPGDTVALPGQPFEWNGRGLQVRRSVELRVAGVDVARLVIVY